MSAVTLKGREGIARRHRQAVATLEAAYAAWRAAKKTAALEADVRGKALDAWILTLGDARAKSQKADRELIAARREAETNPPTRRK